MSYNDELNLDFFALDGQPRIEVTKEHEALMSAFAVLFDSALGQQVLDAIRERTIEKPTMPPQAADGEAMAILMGLREGENNLYRWIQSNIKKGRNINAGISHSSNVQ